MSPEEIAAMRSRYRRIIAGHVATIARLEAENRELRARWVLTRNEDLS